MLNCDEHWLDNYFQDHGRRYSIVEERQRFFTNWRLGLQLVLSFTGSFLDSGLRHCLLSYSGSLPGRDMVTDRSCIAPVSSFFFFFWQQDTSSHILHWILTILGENDM